MSKDQKHSPDRPNMRMAELADTSVAINKLASALPDGKDLEGKKANRKNILTTLHKEGIINDYELKQLDQ